MNYTINKAQIDAIQASESHAYAMEVLYGLPDQAERELLAYAVGTFGGRFVYAPCDGKSIFPDGMAFYAAPSAQAFKPIKEESA
jgi:hypothetical protein